MDMHQLNSFEQYIHYRNDQLDGMSNIYENNNVFSTTSRIGKVCSEHKIYYPIQIVILMMVKVFKMHCYYHKYYSYFYNKGTV